MKTFKSYIKEKWVSSKYNMTGNPISIFKNPTKKEFREVLAETPGYEVARGLCMDYGKGDLYIFPNTYLHATALKEVAKSTDLSVVCLFLHKKGVSITTDTPAYTHSYTKIDKAEIEWRKNLPNNKNLKTLYGSTITIDEEIQPLQEKFVDYTKFQGKDFPIFKNPSKREFNDAIESNDDPIYKNLRWIVTKNGSGDIYVFSYRVLHNVAGRQAKILDRADNLYGEWDEKRNKAQLYYWDSDEDEDILMQNLKSNQKVKNSLPSGVRIVNYG